MGDEIERVLIPDEIRAGLRVADQRRHRPHPGFQIVRGEKALHAFVLAHKVPALVPDHVYGVLPQRFVCESGGGDVFPRHEITALDDAVEVSGVRARVVPRFSVFHARGQLLHDPDIAPHGLVRQPVCREGTDHAADGEIVFHISHAEPVRTDRGQRRRGDPVRAVKAVVQPVRGGGPQEVERVRIVLPTEQDRVVYAVDPPSVQGVARLLEPENHHFVGVEGHVLRRCTVDRTEGEPRFLVRRILRVRSGVRVIGHVEHIADDGKGRYVYHFVDMVLGMRRAVAFVFLKVRENVRLHLGDKPVAILLCGRILLRTDVPEVGRDRRGRGQSLGKSRGHIGGKDAGDGRKSGDMRHGDHGLSV